MVDSFLDNLSLRTHRRGFLNLELHSQTSREQVSQLLPAIINLLKENKQVDTSTTLLSDVNKDALVVQVEYFVLAGTQEIFNKVKQEINLGVIDLLDHLGIRLATKDMEVVLKKE